MPQVRARLELLVIAILMGGAWIRAAEPASPPGPRGENAMLPTGAADTEFQERQALIEKRIATIENSAALSEDQKQSKFKLLQSALKALKDAYALGQDKRRFDEDAAEAPERIRSLRAQQEGEIQLELPMQPDENTIASIESYLGLIQDALRAAKAEKSALESQIKRRSGRQPKLPEELAEATRELDALATGEEEGKAGEPLVTLSDEELLTRMRRRMLEAKVEALQAEMQAYQAEVGLLPLRQDVLTQRIRALQKVTTTWKASLENKRREQSETLSETAKRAVDDAANVNPVFEAYARTTQELSAHLAEGTDALSTRLGESSRQLEELRRRIARLQSSHEELRATIKLVGLNRTTAMELLRARNELRAAKRIGESDATLQNRISELQMKIFNLQDQRADLSVPEDEARRLMERIAPPPPADEQEQLLERALEIVRQRRSVLDTVLQQSNQLMTVLVQIRSEQLVLKQYRAAYRAYLESKALWAQNAGPLRVELLGASRDGLAWLVQPAHWAHALSVLRRDVVQHVPVWIVSALLLTAVFVFQHSVEQRLKSLKHRMVNKTTTVRFHILCLVCCFAAAAWKPAIIWFLGWRLEQQAGVKPFVLALGVGLQGTAVVWFFLAQVRKICKRGGLLSLLAPHHEAGYVFLAANVRRIGWLILPGVWIAATFDAQDNLSWHDSLSRVGVTLTATGLFLCVLMILSPSKPLMGPYVAHGYGWQRMVYRCCHGVLLLLSLAAMILMLLGYAVAARQITESLLLSLTLGFWLLIAHAYVLRLSQASKRRLLLQQGETTNDEVVLTAEGMCKAEDSDATLLTPTAHAPFILSLLQWAVAVGLLLWIWNPFMPAIRVLLDQTTLYAITNAAGVAQNITLGSALWAVLSLLAMALAYSSTPSFYSVLLFSWTKLDRGLQYAILTLTRYGIIVAGVVFSMTTLGVKWGAVQWLIAALSVGLGFGLQEIFSNMVSGLLILLERSIRPGDTVSVNGVSGEVTNIQIRATTIRQWDRKELLVPNKEFITGQVVNWNLSDNTLRVEFPIGVAYGSDTQAVQDALYDVAHANPLVLREPGPRVLFLGFGDSALDFELRAYVVNDERGHFLTVRHEINLAIDKAFREAGIEIPFPQRDVHIRSQPLSGTPPIADEHGKPEHV